jgi:transcriptional regulator with XRE-family HTH domain
MRVLQPIQDADKLDVEIGGRLRQARKARGLSQTQLGESIGVTFQQIQKYERGTNRISSSALILLARTLQISPLELMGESVEGRKEMDWDLLGAEGADQLLRTYREINSPRLRRIVLDLARELARASAQEGMAA